MTAAPEISTGGSVHGRTVRVEIFVNLGRGVWSGGIENSRKGTAIVH